MFPPLKKGTEVLNICQRDLFENRVFADVLVKVRLLECALVYYDFVKRGNLDTGTCTQGEHRVRSGITLPQVTRT